MELLSILNMASNASLWRGLDYANQGRVEDLHRTDDGAYDAEVRGTADRQYAVHVDIAHPRSSSCTCPHAAGTRRICKHMVATVFTVRPEQIDVLNRIVEQEELEAQREEERHREELVRYVNGLKKDELRKALLDALFELEELRQNRWW